jgi:hypothetical protein
MARSLTMRAARDIMNATTTPMAQTPVSVIMMYINMLIPFTP